MSYTIDKGEKTISILDNEEEMQKIADDLLREVYALGGQQVGGAPLCK